MPKLGSLMISPPLTARPTETIADVAQRMALDKVGGIVVVDDSGTPMGIFTERDLVRAAAAGTDSQTILVYDWMTPNPMTMHPDGDASEALETILERGFRHIPIVDKNELVGIVSLTELVPAVGHANVHPKVKGKDLLAAELSARDKAKNGGA